MKMGFKTVLMTAINIAGLAAAFTGAAQTVPEFKTFTKTGTSSAEIIIPAQPLQQIRVVGAIVTSDKAGSVLSFTTGTTPYTVGLSNAAGTTITLTYTNGLYANTNVVVSSAATNCSGTISSFSGTTNIVLSAAAFQTLPGMEVFAMGAASPLPVGAATQNYQGEALFVGNKGRPVRVVLDGTSACSIAALTVRYE